MVATGDYDNLYITGDSTGSTAGDWYTTTATGTTGNIVFATDPYVAPKRKMIEFFRVNEKAHMDEGGEYPEPLDELRLKIARWLNGNKSLLVEV